MANKGRRIVATARFEATVLWANQKSNRLAVQDADSAALLDVDLPQWGLKPGERIVMEGTCVAEQGRLIMRNAPLVENDGTHPVQEKSGSILLAPGKYPIRAEYFNAGALFGFSVEMEGGGMPRQPIPNSALSRSKIEEREIGVSIVPGLNYAYYLGSWLMLPNFAAFTPAAAGATANFTLSPRTRDTNFALVFTGWIEIPKAAEYTFIVSSDDGSRLWIDDSPVKVTRLGAAPLPSPRPIDLQALAPGQLSWSSVEGVVHFITRERDGSLVLEIDSNGREIEALVDDANGPAPAFMSRVRVDGIAQNAQGKTRLFVPGVKNFQTVHPAPATPGSGSGPEPFRAIDAMRRASSGRYPITAPAQIEGAVLAASPSGDALILQSGSEATLIEMGFAKKPVAVGQRIRIEGMMTSDATGLRAPDPLLIDNDGTHGRRERSAAIHLKAGKHPLSVGYFNGLGGAVLEVFFQGPDLPRQKIPDSALSHYESAPGKNGRFLPGLEFTVFENYGARVPKFTSAIAKTNGVAANFDIAVARLESYFAISFQGFVDIPRDGQYLFSLNSDDGSVMALDPDLPRVVTLGSQGIPLPRPVAPRQVLGGDQPEIWAAVEGVVSFASMRGETLTLDLSAASGHMQVEVLHAANAAPMLLRGCRVRVVGICQNAFGADGQRIAASMRTPSLNQVSVLEAASRLWADYRVTTASSVNRQGAGEGENIAHVAGRNRGRVGDGLIAIEDQSGTILADRTLIADEQKSWIEVVGRVARVGTNTFLSGAIGRPLTGDEDLEAMRLLTTIDEVKSLSRAEAERGYPVRVRGVITALMDVGFFLQDATRSIYVEWAQATDGDAPQVGDYWEAEGVTFVEFAPNIRARRAARIGPGTLPDPVRPTWDQLISGSLDTHFIEIEGVIISSEDGEIMLMTRSGQLLVNASEIAPQALKDAENARVRLRGCYAPERDEEKQQIIIGKIMLYNPSMSVDEPAPGDSFQAPLKHASDLLRFDTQAGALQRVKVRGQILREREGEYFLYDNPTGLRFTVRGAKPGLQPGDLVEIVGFPELERLTPKVRFANVRKLGHASLPPAAALAETNLLKSEFEATRVTVEGNLLNVRESGDETVLEMQTGPRVFLARLAGHEETVARLPVGARLRLAGVYAGRTGDRGAEAGEMEAFELLLNSPSDIAVLQRPSWWNIRHTAAVVASLSFVLFAAAAWIKSLRRRVEQRTRELSAEVEVRRKAEEEALRAKEIADTANCAKSQFLATMSHEIRTPMNGVLGMTNLLLETGLNEEQRDFAQTTRQCADALLTIINDILDFSKVEAGKLDFESVDFDLIETIESTVDVLAERAHQKSVELIVDIHRDIPRQVRGDAARLRQILMNLVGNGVKFTPEGEVSLQVRMTARDEKRAHIFFAIRDTGIGMSEATRAKLFQPFTQADASTTRKYGGTGLGLVISQRLVQIMGSHIEVESAPGAGSSFAFSVAFDLAQSPEPSFILPATLQGKRALVVEDNETAAAVLERQLTDFRMRVARADSSLEALALLRKAAQAGEPFEIVIVDGQLPGMDGQALSKAIHAERNLAQTRVIVASSVCHRVPHDDLQAASVDSQLLKPLRRGQLLNALLKTADGMVLNPALLTRDSQAVAGPGANIAAPARTLKILMAEDNPVNQKVALRQLKKLGYEADTVSNGLEALKAVQQGSYEVILMDCQMPEMDGLEATRQLRAMGNRIWIIAMTANAMQGDREICLAAGMDDYIMKPVRINDLEAALESVSDRSANAAVFR